MSLGQDSRLPDRRVLGKFLRSQHWPSFITPSRFKVPAHSDPLKCWNFRKADWKRFCLLTHQILRRHARISTRAHFLRLSNVSHQAVGRTMYHAGTKSARPSIAPLFERQWGLPLTEPACPYSLDYNIRNRSDGRKLSTPSTSRTLAARRGEPSTNLLAGLDAPCAPSRQIPSLRNWWRTGHTRPATASPPGLSTRSCPTYGRF